MAGRPAQQQAKRENRITPKPGLRRLLENRKGNAPKRSDTTLERARISSNQQVSSSMKSPRRGKISGCQITHRRRYLELDSMSLQAGKRCWNLQAKLL